MKNLNIITRRLAALPRSQRRRSVGPTYVGVPAPADSAVVTDQLDGLLRILAPVDASGTELAWRDSDRAVALKVKIPLYSLGDITAFGKPSAFVTTSDENLRSRIAALEESAAGLDSRLDTLASDLADLRNDVTFVPGGTLPDRPIYPLNPINP